MNKKIPDYKILLVDHEDKILILEDLNLGNISLTNGMETALEQISKGFKTDIKSWKIAYRDSDGKFDGVYTTLKNTIHFYYLKEQTAEEISQYFLSLNQKLKRNGR